MLRRRAGRAAVIVGLRGTASRLVALGGTVVLARDLSAGDFGIFALGTSLITCIGYLVQAGLGAGLIRRKAAPSPLELQVTVGVNALVTIALVALSAAVFAFVGGNFIYVTLMVVTLPITAFRTPGVIHFERALSYRPLAQVEVAETLCLYGFAAAAVLLGLGLAGVAGAAAIRVVVGTLLMIHASPGPVVSPRLSGAVVRSLAGFAGRYQGAAVVNFVRDQGGNAAMAAVGGIATLGAFTVAIRLLQLPQLVLEALFRVSFPAMSRLLEAGEDARPMIQRTVQLVALGTGIIVVPLAAASEPLVPAIFGAGWNDAASVVPPVAAGLMIAGPVAVAAGGYLYAMDQGSTVLKSAILHTVAWFAVAIPLLMPLGVLAAGLAVLASGAVEAAVLGRKVHRLTGARIIRSTAGPLVAGGLAAIAGAGVAEVVTASDALRALASAMTAELGFLGLAVGLRPDGVRDLALVIRRLSRPIPAAS